MTSRERVLTALRHQQPDRIPIDLRFAPEAMRKLSQFLGRDEVGVWEWIGQDVVTVRPVFRQCASEKRYADPTIEVSAEGYYLDIYRVPFREVVAGNQVYMEPAGEPPLRHCETPQQLETFPWPRTEDWDYSGIAQALERNRDKATWCRSRGCFQTAQLMRGAEAFLMDMMLDPGLAGRLLDHIMDFVMDDASRTLSAGAGRYTFCEYNDDVASQRGMLFSPETWRAHIKPRMADFCDLVHRHGAKVKYHSCGSVYNIIPDLIEIGVDILNPVQPLAADMDPFRLKDEFGDRLVFHGAVDTQQLLPYGSPEDVRRQVRKLVDWAGKDGGYILAGSHTIQSDVSAENLVALVEEARR